MWGKALKRLSASLKINLNLAWQHKGPLWKCIANINQFQTDNATRVASLHESIVVCSGDFQNCHPSVKQQIQTFFSVTVQHLGNTSCIRLEKLDSSQFSFSEVFLLPVTVQSSPTVRKGFKNKAVFSFTACIIKHFLLHCSHWFSLRG